MVDLAAVHLLPPSPVEISVKRTKRTVDAQGVTYTQYELHVQQGSLVWTILRRYSEFATMHQVPDDLEAFRPPQCAVRCVRLSFL